MSECLELVDRGEGHIRSDLHAVLAPADAGFGCDLLELCRREESRLRQTGRGARSDAGSLAVSLSEKIVEVLRQAADRRIDLRDGLRLGLGFLRLLRWRRTLRLLDLLRWRHMLRLSSLGLDHDHLGAARAVGYEARRTPAAGTHSDLRPIARDDLLHTFPVLPLIASSARTSFAGFDLRPRARGGLWLRVNAALPRLDLGRLAFGDLGSLDVDAGPLLA
jgi:hypothetical protein